MKKGFSTIMSAQFCSSLADNALFMVAVELLRVNAAAPWQEAALVPVFALFFVVLAPFVGAFSDAFPKGKVMLMSNSIKIIGCLMMVFGVHPLIAYSVVGFGAATYSPAKYGILTELLPPSQLVKANGWMEGLTITSIILGVMLGGLLASPYLFGYIKSLHLPNFDNLFPNPAALALPVLVLIYIVAAVINIYIPRTSARLLPMSNYGKEQPFLRHAWALTHNFVRSNHLLWRDKLGQISLATTTLFWGASGNLRYIILAWSAAVLGMHDSSQAAPFLGVVAIGTALGAVFSSLKVKLQHATRVLPIGILMGLLVVSMHWVNQVGLVYLILFLVGVLGGYMVVPMNALLQHRGHGLMGAGRSIAVQNFNEQACILLMGLMYSGATKIGLHARPAMTLFGTVVCFCMLVFFFWHRFNEQRYRGQIKRSIKRITQDYHRQ